ncbi:MAG: MBL fold metallo-hydrolase, partial [Clostridia bacterium]|nr:MBL fold metallo-hydrolase [Deltaproteobacteria bacterium]
MTSYLKITPLGGLGRIGGNMMAFETERDLIIVDCGMLFPGVDQPGVDYLAPDPAYVVGLRHKLRAIVITHGHEDHIGALAETVKQLPAPVYATK